MIDINFKFISYGLKVFYLYRYKNLGGNKKWKKANQEDVNLKQGEEIF